MKRCALVRKAALKRKTRLAKMSRKRRMQVRDYCAKRRQFLASHRWCEACQFFGSGTRLLAEEVHHTAGRSGKNYLDVTTWKAVCRPCHLAVHQSPNTARELGILH